MASPRRRRRAAPPGRVTLADVARAAGVSIASASRALSHTEQVSEALGARVTAAARELAYAPGGLNLAFAGRQRCVGAIVAQLDDGFTAAAVDALVGELARSDASLLLAVSDGAPEATSARIAELLMRGASAIVLCGVAMPALPQSAALLWRVPRVPQVPILSLDGTGVAGEGPGAGFSRAQALTLGVLYLGDLGHVRVALFDARDAATARHVKAQGAARGVQIVDDAASDHADEPALAAMLRRWLSRDLRITGAVCGSDRTAAALIRACTREQIAVPAELAVVGFGNTELSRHTQPALTSLRISAVDVGVALAQRLAAAFAGRGWEAAPLAAKLVVRESTAPAARLPEA